MPRLAEWRVYARFECVTVLRMAHERTLARFSHESPLMFAPNETLGEEGAGAPVVNGIAGAPKRREVRLSTAHSREKQHLGVRNERDLSRAHVSGTPRADVRGKERGKPV